MSTALQRTGAEIISPRSVGQICTPACSSAAPTAPRCSRCAPRISRCPPVIAAAIGVGAGLDAVGDDLVLGAMQRVDALHEDAMRARAFDARAHRLQAEREIADFRIARGVEDFAFASRKRRAHQRGFGRADGGRGENDVPAVAAARRSARADIAAFEHRPRAPSALSAFRCRSTGRAPMAQPPGSDTRARPKRASSGASTRMLARILRTIS